MRKYLIPIMMMLVVCGCSKGKEQTPLEKAENAGAPVAETPADNAPAPEIQANEEAAPVVTAGEHGWYQIVRDELELSKCFDINGCIEGKKRVLAGVEKKKDENGVEGLFCGSSKEAGIRYVAGYRCSPSVGQALCVQEKCECGEMLIGYGEFCSGEVDGEKFAKNSALYKIREAGIGTEESAAPAEPEEETAVNKNVRICGEEAGEIVDDGTYKQFACVTHFWEGTSGFEQGYYVCMKPNGCKTKDGRLYSPLGFVDNNELNSCAYYVSGNVDTTKETLCNTGDCVIPEDVDPSLKLMTIAKYGDFMPSGFSVVQENAEYHPDRYQSNYFVEPDDYFGDDADKLKTLIEGFVVDTEACEGGVRYCHGQKNPPLRIPEQPAGYSCRPIKYYPGVGLNDDGKLKAWMCLEESCTCGGVKCPESAVCLNEKCYCGNVLIDGNDDFGCNSISPKYGENGEIESLALKRYCQGEKCACGTGNCGLNMECRDNQCTCDGIAIPSGDVWNCIGKHSFSLRCGNENGCEVNGQKFLYNARYLSDGRMACADMYDIMPGERYECRPAAPGYESDYAWVCTGNEPCQCFGEEVKPGEICNYRKIVGSCYVPKILTPDGCLCDGKPALPGYECRERADGSTVNVCENGSGCRCGMNTCQYGMFCTNGKCEVPSLNADYAAQYYWREKIAAEAHDAVLCEDKEGCFCGAEKCVFQSYCLDGKCRMAAYSYVRDEHVFSFDTSENYEDEAVYAMMMDESWITCNENVRRVGKPIDFEHSDHLDDYYCDIFEESCSEGECDIPFGDLFSPSGLECRKPDYCMCGGVRCPRNGTCECDLDEDARIRCGCNSPNAVREYSDQTLGCGDSRVPVKQADAYECIGDLGFICKNENCACGSAMCAKGAMCVSSGVCTGVTDYLKPEKK